METSSCRPPVSPLLKKYAGERTQHAKGITFHAHFSQPNAPILVLLAFVGKQFWLQLTCTYTLTCVWLTFDYAYFLMKILPLPSSYLFPANRAVWLMGKSLTFSPLGTRAELGRHMRGWTLRLRFSAVGWPLHRTRTDVGQVKSILHRDERNKNATNGAPGIATNSDRTPRKRAQSAVQRLD